MTVEEIFEWTLMIPATSESAWPAGLYEVRSTFAKKVLLKVAFLSWLGTCLLFCRWFDSIYCASFYSIKDEIWLICHLFIALSSALCLLISLLIGLLFWFNELFLFTSVYHVVLVLPAKAKKLLVLSSFLDHTFAIWRFFLRAYHFAYPIHFN